MSAYTDQLRAANKPKVLLMRELKAEPNPTPDQLATLERTIAELEDVKAEINRAEGIDQKAGEVEDWYANLDDPTQEPRGRTDRPSGRASMEGRQEIKAISDYIAESREYKLGAGGTYNIRMPSAAFTLGETKTVAPTGLFIPGNLESSTNVRIIDPQQPGRFPVLDLLTTIPWNDLVVPYLPLAFDNNADEVDMGAEKPESINTGDIVTVTMRTVAHVKYIPRQIWRYMPSLQPKVNLEMRRGVLHVMQARVINGSGTGTAMRGILAQVTQTGAGDDLIHQIFDGIATVEENEGTVDAILIHPRTYAAMVQAEYDNNQYNPILVGDRIGSYRVVKTNSITQETALLGDFSSAVEFYVGEEANVQATESLQFTRNIVTVRGEMDAVVLVTKPWLLVKCPGPLVDITP